MVQTRAHERRRKPAPTTAREALLAATTMQLQPGDLLSGAPGDPAITALAPTANHARRPAEVVFPATISNHLTLCSAAARGLQGSGPAGESPLLLAFATSGVHEPGWKDALTWAQQAELPLLLACTDASSGKPSRPRRGEPAIDWAAITQLSRRTGLPVLSVDGEDAVAVYRVMQECVLRTRLGAGPAVIWAVMSPATQDLPATDQPIARLRRYMAARKIALH
jgi:hypothetical protein